MKQTTLLYSVSCFGWRGRQIFLALIGLFIIFGLKLALAQTSTLDVPAAVSSASMANRADSWQATWSAATAAHDGLGVMPDIVWQENGRHDSDGRWRVIRPFLVFPISGLPAESQITGASLILRIASIHPPLQSSYDNQTYVRVVLATPQNSEALTASDFGSAAFETLYSGKHFVQDMVVGTDLVIPLDQTIFGKITNGNTLTLALINGHELENVDHWPVFNVHTHVFTASAPSSTTPPLLRVAMQAQCDPPPDIFVDNTKALGLFEGIVQSVTTNGITAASFRIQPTEVIFDPLTFDRRGVALWFSIEAIRFFPSTDIATVNPDPTDPVGELAAEAGLLPPDGRVTFQVRFCEPGEVRFILAYNTRAASLTLRDAIIPITSLSEAAAFRDALLEVPLYNSAVSHYVNAFQSTSFRGFFRELSLATRDLFQLARNDAQLQQLRDVFARFGIEILLGELVQRILARLYPLS